MEIFKKTPQIKFMKYKVPALILTGVIVAAGLVNILFFDGLKPGIDFGGGTLIRVMFDKKVSIGQIRNDLERVGLGNSSIQESGSSGREFQIRTTQFIKASDEQKEIEAHEKLGTRVIEALKGHDNMTVLSRETVGPQAGKEMRRKATQATIWALIGMLVYIAVRFKVEYGVAAIFTLTQDVLITLSIYTFTGREINLPIIAALLTIVGFSINDTIVIFDRVRENSKIFRKESLEEVMNLSINQCLGRTLITSGTVFLTLLSLFLFGGPVINDFAFIMLIGAVEGICSTVALSCPVVLFWHKTFKTKKGFRK